MSSQSYRIAFLPPPGECVRTARPFANPANQKTSTAPQVFLDAVAIRTAVFIDEQKVSVESEIDNEDEICSHWVLYAREGEHGSGPEVPAATLRLVPPEPQGSDQHSIPEQTEVGGPTVNGRPYLKGSLLWDHKECFAHFGRLATMKAFRGRGYGRVLMEEAFRHGKELASKTEADPKGWHGLVSIHAQVQVEGWYRKLGFETDLGLGSWWEEGILHVGMWKRL